MRCQTSKNSELAKNKWLLIFILLILAAISHTSLNSIERFEVLDKQLLKDPSFSQKLKYWQKKGEQSLMFIDSTVQIVNKSSASQTIRQSLQIETPATVRLAVKAGGVDIVTGSERWAGGSVVLVPYDETGHRTGSTAVAIISETMEARLYSKTVFLNRDISRVEVAIRLLKSSGSFQAGELQLTWLQERSSYKITRITVGATWAVVALLLLILVLKYLGKLGVVLFAGLPLIVLLGILLPEPFIATVGSSLAQLIPQSILSWIQEILATYFGYELQTDSARIVKFGHFAAFLIVGTLIGWTGRYIGFGFGFGLVSIATFAIITEVLQMLVNGRSASVIDIFIDIAGAALGMCLGVIFFYVNLCLRELKVPN